MAVNLDGVLEKHEAEEADKKAREEGAIDSELNKDPFTEAVDQLKEKPACTDLLDLMKPGIKNAPIPTKLEGILLDFPTYGDFVNKAISINPGFVTEATVINTRAIVQPLYEFIKKQEGGHNAEAGDKKPWLKKLFGI